MENYYYNKTDKAKGMYKKDEKKWWSSLNWIKFQNYDEKKIMW